VYDRQPHQDGEAQKKTLARNIAANTAAQGMTNEHGSRMNGAWCLCGVRKSLRNFATTRRKRTNKLRRACVAVRDERPCVHSFRKTAPRRFGDQT